MLTLGALLRELDLRLVAGASGADHPVRWVHISELADPTPFLSGGELLLTTGMQLEDPDDQREYVARLAGHGLAGLGLGTGFAHERLPDAMVAAAEELGFALFEVPYEVPFIAVTEKAFTHLVNEHYAVLQRALSAHERLERIVLSERGLDGVAGALASLIGGPAIIFDARGEVLARRAARSPLQESAVAALSEELRERARAGGRRGYAPGGELAGRALALPVPRTPQGNAPAGDGPAPQAGLRRAQGRPAAAGVARRGQGRRAAVRVRPPHAAPGGHGRRARAAPPSRRRRHRAPARRARRQREGVGRARRRRARASAAAVRATGPCRRRGPGAAAAAVGRHRG